MRLVTYSFHTPESKAYGECKLLLRCQNGLGTIIALSVGRRDDVLVLGSGTISFTIFFPPCKRNAPGEKVVPLPQEGSITASSMVSGAVVFGIGQSQCGVLIEPSTQFATYPSDARALIEFTNKIWCFIFNLSHP